MKELVKGLSWIGLLRLCIRGLTIVRIAILARILSPAQFGVFGIAGLVLGFVEIIAETGVNILLIQEKRIEHLISSAYIVSIARGFLIGMFIFIIAPIIVSFFNSPEALLLLQLISLVPIIKGFIHPSIILFQKEMKFKQEFYFRTVVLFVEFFITIIIALIYKSPMCFILGLIAGAITEVMLSHIQFGRIQLSFKKEYVHFLFNRGKWISATGIGNYLFHHIDDFFVGKLLGTTSLGIYDVAYKISMVPITEFADVINRILFPFFVSISENKEHMKNYLLKITLCVLAILFPIGMVFIIFPEYIITILLGPQWIASANILRILAVFGIVKAVANTFTPVFMANKKQNYTAIISFISVIILVTFIIPFIKVFDLNGAGYASVIASLGTFPFVLYFTKKTLSTNQSK